MEPQYIGDGVYIQEDKEDPTRLILTTGSHILTDADNVIYLEQREARNIAMYVNKWIMESHLRSKDVV
jgi:hypothetical protein